MKILIADGFKGYASAADMSQAWAFGAAPVLTNPGGGGASEVRATSGFPRSVMTRGIPASARAAISADVRLPAATGNAVIGLSPAGYADRNRGDSGQSPRGVYVSISGVTPRLYYDILTGPTGTTVNSLLLAEMPPLAGGATYHVEMIVDHTSPAAKTRVYINGTLAADVSYDRDRVLSGHQASTFGEVTLLTSAALVAAYPQLSNIVVYDPEAPAAPPVGPMDVTYLTAPDAALSIGPAVDSTGITISDNAWADIEFSDLSAGGQILGAELLYRLSAVAGQNPAAAEIALEAAGYQVGTTAKHAITPGYAPRLISLQIPKTAAAAGLLNVMKMKIRSDAGDR